MGESVAERSFVLASGKSVRVAADHVAVLDMQGATMTSRPLAGITSVSRNEKAVLIKANRQRTLQIDLRTVDDAEGLEASLTAALRRLSPEERSALHESTVGEQTPRSRHPFTIAGFVCATLVMLGSLGPWITRDATASAGIDGDGAITLLLGAVAATLLYITTRTNAAVVRRLRVLRVLAALSFLAAAVTAGNVMNTVWTAEQDTDFGVGWGLWLVVLASIVGAGVSMVKPRTA